MPATDSTAPLEARFMITRRFEAPRQRVWDAFVDPDRLAQWYGPKGSTTTLLSHDIRPGGLLHYRMTTPDGGPLYGRFVYREIAEPSRLVWVTSFSDATGGITRAPFFDGRFPLEMLTVVTFEDDGAGTRITLTWTPIDAAEEEHRTIADNTDSFREGWGGSFERLDRVLAERLGTS